MNRIKKITQWLLDYPLVALIFIYLYWLVSIPNDVIIRGLFLFAAYLVITLSEKYLGRNVFISFIILLISFLIGLPSIFYAVLAILLIKDYGIENIPSAFVLIFGTALTITSTFRKLTANNQSLSKITFVCTLPLLLLNILFFSIYYPTIRDTAFFQNNRYHVVNEISDDFRSFQVFYKCNLLGFYCEALYSSIGYRDAKIIVDNDKNEISLYENFGLSYTYGFQLRYYEGYPTQHDRQIYELGWYCDKVSPSDCNKVDYILYECESDYTGCTSLPIQYTSYYNNSYLELESNEETGEVNLFNSSNDPPTIIFTWGEHPRCYVEGCKILEEIK